MGRASIVAVALLAGCTTVIPGGSLDELVAQALQEARAQHASQHDLEAWQFVQAVERAAPRTPGLAELVATLGPRPDDRPQPAWMGSNVARRTPVERTALQRALLYVPDRLLDLADIVSFNVHIGPGLYANVHATRAGQLGGGLRTVLGLGWYDGRSAAYRWDGEASLRVAAFGPAAVVTDPGTWPDADSDLRLGWVETPFDPLYLDERDYWAVGAAFTVAGVGADLDVHPLEIVDFLCGLATVDLLDDDLARTRALRLDADQWRLIRRIHSLASSRS